MSYSFHRQMNKNKNRKNKQGKVASGQWSVVSGLWRAGSGRRLESRGLFVWLTVAILVLVVWPASLGAAERAVRINLGTLAPRGSVYHKSLQAMAEAWRQAPGGGVRLVVYPDGTQGGETDMVKLMRVGSLQAGLLSAVGLADIEPGIGGLQDIPMVFNSLEESQNVTEQVRPTLEKRLAEKGFVALFWGDAGWVHYFSKEPVITPDDLCRMKIFVWAGSPDQVSIMRHQGYTPVPLETADILPGLQTGMITAAPLAPIFALAAQVDLRAPHMLNLNWAPLVGACVVKKDVWEKIPAASREALMTAAARAGAEIRQGSRKESVEAVAAMQKRGLTVHDLSPDLVERWRQEAEKSYPEIRGHIVPAEIFDEVRQRVQADRSADKK